MDFMNEIKMMVCRACENRHLKIPAFAGKTSVLNISSPAMPKASGDPECSSRLLLRSTHRNDKQGVATPC